MSWWIEAQENMEQQREIDWQDANKLKEIWKNDTLFQKVVWGLAGRDSMMYKMMKWDIKGLKSERIINDDTHNKIDKNREDLEEAAGL